MAEHIAKRLFADMPIDEWEQRSFMRNDRRHFQRCLRELNGLRHDTSCEVELDPQSAS